MKQFYHFALTMVMSLSLSITALAQNKYVKVQSEPADWTGTYLIVYEADDENNVANVFNGALKEKELDSKGNFFSVSNAPAKIYGTEVRVIEGNDQTDAAVFRITRAKDEALQKNHIIIVESEKRIEHEWDTQFWIVSNSTFHGGDSYEFSMEVRADKKASAGSQIHKQPGDYLHWEGVGTVKFDTDWTTYTSTGKFPAQSDGGQSIALNLNDFEEANKYYFRNISLKINGVEQVNNGDLKGEDLSSLVAKEKRGATVAATLFNEDGSPVGGQAYYIQSASGYYIGYDNAEKGEPNLEYSNETPFANSIAMESGKTSINIIGSVGNYQLRFNADEGKERFRYHELGKKKSIKFYQLMEAGDAPGNDENASPVVINEVMQSNIDCIMDDIHEFPDSWVELYNKSVVPINLKDYKIGLTDNAAEAFSLSDCTLGAKSYKIVYCDKYDGNKAWHAPFRLESGKGGSIYLFKGNEVVDKIVEMKKQPAPNIAYGRETDGAEEQGYQAVPTPGKANCGTLIAAKKLLGNPVFSVLGRVFESAQSFDLTLSLPEDAPKGAKIVYTTDGKEPIESSTVYTEPIKISSSQVIRAKVVCDGYMSPRSLAQSYLFMGRKMTLPVVSLVTDRDYFYGSKNGIYNSNNNSDNKLDWRRPLNIEYFAAPNEDSKINQLGETRVAGGGSRSNTYKTLVLYANKRFDADKKRFSYEFFPEDRPGKTEFKSLMLRNAGNDFDYAFMRDAIMQRSFAWNVDLDYQAYSPTIVYINGEYLGMLNMRERSNEDNIYTNYDKLEDIDMFENWYELKTGTWDNKNAFEKFYTDHGHTMEEYEQWMDIDEYINYMFMEIFYNNQDFPSNNIVMWRPIATGGKWRWIAKDTDFGLGLYGSPYNYKTIDWIYDYKYDKDRNWGNTADATRLFRRLMDDPDFNRAFIERAAIYMGDFVNVDRVWEIVDPMYAKVKSELAFHKEAVGKKNGGYNQWWPNYAGELNNAKDWLTKRPDFFYQHLADYYKLGKPTKLEINTTLTDTDLADIEVEMNGVKLTRNVFDGKFFQDREVKLSGKNVAGWTVVVEYAGEATGVAYEGPELTFKIPECSSVSIRATVNDRSGIEQLETEKEVHALDIYDANGIRHSKLQKGQNIIRMSDGSTKKVFF